MTPDKVLVAVGGIAAILFIAWFFFGKKEREVAVASSAQILVDGGYSPQVITLKRGQTVRLGFLRKDPSSCLEEVVLPDFGIRRTLPMNQTTEVEITPQTAGEFAFSCGMNMYHGKIKVAE